MIVNLIEDVSTLTDVSETTLKKFLPIMNYVISHSLYESICERQDVTTVDLGIGRLNIKQDENQLCYRFIPSKDLEKLLVQTVSTNTSPLINKIDAKLQEKIDRAYKEVL